MLKKLLGKKKNKKTKLMDLNGQDFIDAYNKQMTDTGKATLAEKAKFSKIRAKQREKAYNMEY
tara:strand:+ start:658 stop:846 length:189 start_codon:yes stop_codon:yes gene_type:complete